MSREKYRAVQTVDIYQFISDLKINLRLSNNSKIYTISIFLNFDHVIIWMYAIDVLQVVLWKNSFSTNKGNGINVVGKGGRNERENGNFQVRKFEMKSETMNLASSIRGWKGPLKLECYY